MPFYTHPKLPGRRKEMSEAQGRAFARAGWELEKPAEPVSLSHPDRGSKPATKPAEQSRTATTKGK